MESSPPMPVRDSVTATRARRQALSPGAEAHLARLEQVFCDPSRLRIVQALRAGPLTVGDLAAVIQRTVPGTSQHLRVLRDAGVVEGERRGSLVYYRLCGSSVSVAVQTVLDAATRATPGEA